MGRAESPGYDCEFPRQPIIQHITCKTLGSADFAQKYIEGFEGHIPARMCVEVIAKIGMIPNELLVKIGYLYFD